MSEKKARVPMTDKDRGIAFVVLAMSFNIVGLGSLAFGNVPVCSRTFDRVARFSGIFVVLFD